MFGRISNFVSNKIFGRSPPMVSRFSDEQYEGRVLEDLVGDFSLNGQKKDPPQRPRSSVRAWPVKFRPKKADLSCRVWGILFASS